MTKTEFLKHLAGALMTEPAKVLPDTRLDSLASWDSMGQIAVLSLLDTKLDKRLPSGALQNCQSVGDILALAQDKLAD